MNQAQAALCVPPLAVRKVIEKHNFLLYISCDDGDIYFLAKQMSFFLSDATIIVLPDLGVPPYGMVLPEKEISMKRVYALYQLAHTSLKNVVFVTTAKALMRKLPPLQSIDAAIQRFEIGIEYDRHEIMLLLGAVGYTRVSIAESIGEFAVRGSIIDIVVNSSSGIRLDFIGNRLDSIKSFDVLTQSSIGKLKSAEVLPASEVILLPPNIARFQQEYSKYLKIGNGVVPQLEGDYESVMKSIGNNGSIEQWGPLFYNEELLSISVMMPKNAAILIEGLLDIVAKKYWEEIHSQYIERDLQKEYSYKPLPPEMLYFDPGSLMKKLKEYNIMLPVTAANFPGITETPRIFSNDMFQEDSIQRLAEYQSTYNTKVLIACSSTSSIERVRHILANRNIHTFLVQCYQEFIESKSNGIALAVLEMQKGFVAGDIVVFPEHEVFGHKLVSAPRKRCGTSVQRLWDEIFQLQAGDLVAHVQYGIGKFCGLTTLIVQGVTHDFIEIIYAGNDKLYVPVENLETVTRYSNGDGTVQLDKLGGTSWQARRAKLKERIKLTAAELLKVAATRQELQGIRFTLQEDIYETFCKQFPYLETEDQSFVIQEVLHDLASGEIMDRLVCGDVGFGKTEIALRAACVVALSDYEPSYQVAVVVPTTLLARQHYSTFRERFASFPIIVEQLSRMTHKGEVKRIKEGIASGFVNIVVGTHALLAEDMKFHNLGLVILDEEHHFGVKQKEQLKKIRTNVHVLTLSATPIPRTLQMAFAEIKSFSLILTPPINRKPVKTFIIAYDDITIRDAILNERGRGGKVFFVTPRISYLNEIEQRLCCTIPDIKIAKVHAGLSSVVLDNIMNDFYDGKFDVLLSTSIIESGLDFPMANTLIVDRANIFGLAQLHQLRGRVGRGDVTAYAYFTVHSLSDITDISKKRLAALQSMDQHGAGFSIASYDLNMRGYGNLLGEEQSGYIKEVGFELYQRMLTEAVSDLKSDILHGNNSSAVHHDWSPVINLCLAVQIPESYVQDATLRLSLYRQLAEINTVEGLENFAIMLRDRFGELPKEIENLVLVIRLKQISKAMGIAQIDIGERGVVMKFKDKETVFALAKLLTTHSSNYSSTVSNPQLEALVHLFTRSTNIKFKLDGKLSITFDDKIAGVSDVGCRIRSGIEWLLDQLIAGHSVYQKSGNADICCT